MAYTTFGVNDSNAVKIWSKFLAKSERDSLEIAPLMGDDDRAIIHVKEDTDKGPGDQVKFNLRARLTGDGTSESETAEGNGESLTFYQDSIVINELGHVVGSASENTIDQQRVPFELRSECKNGLSDWWKDRKSVSFFNQVCGNNAQTNTKYTGLNPTAAPAGTSALTRHIWPSTHADDQSVTSNDVMTTALIDKAKQKAKIGSQMVRPVMVGGQKKYVMYMSEDHVLQLRNNTTGNLFQEITKFQYSGTDVSKNPYYNGALGEWNGVILRVSQDVTQGVNASTGAADTDTRRAVLLGAQAAACAYGRKGDYKNSKYRWNEELLDHKRKLEVSAWQIWGLKKCKFNSVDYGTIVVTAYGSV
jgi:N4-gp56 family major capsid protein